LPAAQLRQVADPEAGWYEPALQLVQVDTAMGE
jgi:hypothetical protein